jgi:ribulose-phosphate 3-epimerase
MAKLKQKKSLLENIISNSTKSISKEGKTYQFLRFCLVGGLATILNYSLFFLLYKLGVNHLLASASGYISGVFLGFYLNKRFTFNSDSRRYAVEITKYFIVYTISLFLGLGFLQIQTNIGMHILIANIFTIGLTTITNYIGCNFFVFRKDAYKSKIDFLLYRYKYLIRFTIIGIGSLFTELLIIQLITIISDKAGLKLPIYISIAAGFVLGLLFSFIINSKINFPVSKERHLKTFRTFIIISIFSFALNIILMKLVFSNFTSINYSILRFITAAMVFTISYILHRKFTFVDVKEIGIAIYLSKSENLKEIKSKITSPPDFIHLDLIDTTFNPNAKEVDVNIGKQASKMWPQTKTLTHIMSKTPTKWIDKTQQFSDYLIFHIECDEKIDDVIALCRKYRKKTGLCTLHNTPIDSIVPYLSKIDIVQVLGIPTPGESGQFLESKALDKLAVFNELAKKYKIDICFDGGVKISNIHKIDAKYVVSASAVLNAQNPKKAIYDLKTNARYYTEKDIEMKEFIRKEIKKTVERTPFALSGTIVGSFATSKGLEGISDIDTVIIIDKLSKDKFNTIVTEFEKIGKKLTVDYDYEYKINPTFGPLKYNKDRLAVFHLMIYDVEGHIKHCQNSPFTCLDWQLSETYFKAPMTSIYKVTALQPNFFFDSRRSVNDYLKDLRANSISYREYNFKEDGQTEEVKKQKKMDDKDKVEFSYHIMRNLMNNLIKLYHNQNKNLPAEKILEEYLTIFGSNRERYEKYFMRLKKAKMENSTYEWKKTDENILKEFIEDFSKQFRDRFDNTAKKIFFVRHQKNEMNKPDLFVGQNTDPPIKEIKKEDITNPVKTLAKYQIAQIFSSPLKRSAQTAETFKQALNVKQLIIDDRLSEINYGTLDGKTLDFLKENNPAMIKQWENGKDPRFPEGENSEDVQKRTENFLKTQKEILTKGHSIICTHNVVMRGLIGKKFNIPKRQWHLINIPHIEPVEFVITKEGKEFINLEPDQIRRFFEKVKFGD